jgi:hypothetical protein
MKRLALTFFAVLAVACGSDVTSNSSSSGSGGANTSSSSATGGDASSSSGTGGGVGGTGGSGGGDCSANGDCNNDGDCPNGACVALTTCGFKVCEEPIPPATSCNDPQIDQCCDVSDCGDEETCVLWPFGPYCGGIQPQPNNQCVADQCEQASDCPAPPPAFVSICTPASTLGFPTRTCFIGTCQVDGDCSAEAGGICAPVTTACCSSANIVACVYPSDGCRSDNDCGNDAHCDIDGEAARCLPGPALCPG